MAQAPAGAVEEPQYINQFFELGPDGKLVPLEQLKLTQQHEMHNHFISVTASSERTAPGAASSVRVPPAAHFIIKTNPGMESIDPNTLYALKPFVVKKDLRALPVTSTKGGMFQSAKSQTVADNSIPVNFKKYGSSSMEIVPAQPLPPGEYVLANGGGYSGVFCFGVDAK